MLSRIGLKFISKNILYQTYRCGVIQLNRNQSSVAIPEISREEVEWTPPYIPKIVRDGPDIKDYDPRQQTLEEYLNIRFGPEMPTIHDESNPERDTVNFPRPKFALFPDKSRMFIFPDSWFQLFYPKTGVTGPYVFGFTFFTFLLSKEYFVFDHEWYSGSYFIALVAILVNYFGPQLNAYAGSLVDKEANLWLEWQKGMIGFCDEFIETEKKEQTIAKSQNILFNAKRENIKLQLEAEYRRRLMTAYREVRNRLEFLIAKQNAQRQYQQKHMVNWIIDSVVKAITPQQEKEALQKCIADLKNLSNKHQISQI